jgi:hypothetical protein
MTVLLNQSLAPRRVKIIETILAENSLILKLQGRIVPNQYKLLPFLAQELKCLGIESIERVTVYGLTEESASTVWEESFTLTPDCSIVNQVTKIDSLTITKEERVENDSEALIEGQETPDSATEDATEESAQSSEHHEAEEISFPPRYSPVVTTAGSSLSLMPMITSLAIGFGVGIMTGMYCGYQKAVRELPASMGTIEQTR